jgi:hypothetical protein
MIHLYIIHPSTPGSPKWSLSLGFSRVSQVKSGKILTEIHIQYTTEKTEEFPYKISYQKWKILIFKWFEVKRPSLYCQTVFLCSILYSPSTVQGYNPCTIEHKTHSKLRSCTTADDINSICISAVMKSSIHNNNNCTSINIYNSTYNSLIY